MMYSCIPNGWRLRCAAYTLLLLSLVSLPLNLGVAKAISANNEASTAPTASAYPSIRLLDTRNDILGQPFSYPAGDARLLSDIITLAPGEEGALHRHLVPMFAYLLEGELTVDYGPQGRRNYRAGEALVEAVGVLHRGFNHGTAPVKILVVYISANDADLIER
jgi:quercetin dioxygenase-like cupin family protein